MNHCSPRTKCNQPNCSAEYHLHKFGKMEASRLGWFIQRNGDSWCPEHIPDWVTEWRKKRNQEHV